DRAVDRAERREQARHADREAGRRHGLLAEAGDEAIVAPSAADRAEPHRAARFVLDLEGQLRLEDGPGVIFEAADDGRVDANSINEVFSSQGCGEPGCLKRGLDLREFSYPS